MTLTLLGDSKAPYRGLETFPKPHGLQSVSCISDEFTAICPVTGQPDWYTLEITYEPDERCVESKSLKFFLHTYRNHGIFCEALACEIADRFSEVVAPKSVTVRITQKSRGGIAIIATTKKEKG